MPVISKHTLSPPSLLVAVLLTPVLILGGASGAVAQDDAQDDTQEDAQEDAGRGSAGGDGWRFGVEASAHFRSSDDTGFPVTFPFTPEQVPVGQSRVLLQTVDPGDHFEVSAVTFTAAFRWPGLEAFFKVDGIDLHDRNPTGSDREIDLDEAWVAFGRQTETATLAPRTGGYVKLGKIPHFERQNDRHLESYGLVSTAFNRFEDVGLEGGLDLGRHLYVKAAFTSGNPLFMRDPNVLAGDNGTAAFRRLPPDPEYRSGIVIPYDADVDDADFSDPEVAVGIGLRFADPSGRRGLEALAFGSRRDLADTVDLGGTFYGGDLDLLRGPSIMEVPFAIDGREKTEIGANLWLYMGAFTGFLQVVDQELAGLERAGAEVELAHRFDLPLGPAAWGRQIFPHVAPAIRYSSLDPDYAAPFGTPTPSFAWDWEKLDAGLRIGLIDRTDLTLEWGRNRIELASGAKVDTDETLATVRVRVGR